MGLLRFLEIMCESSRVRRCWVVSKTKGRGMIGEGRGSDIMSVGEDKRITKYGLGLYRGEWKVQWEMVLDIDEFSGGDDEDKKSEKGKIEEGEE